ncbi:MAG: hypothetical protein L0191_20270, partial [Acidobacteria bacterium]|nr:hypothetical protein [Acidobacteriota bacterium]
SLTDALRREGVATKLVSDHPHLFETGGENYHVGFFAWEYVRGHEGDPWRHSDPRVDQLQGEIQALVRAATARGESRREIFAQVWLLAEQVAAGSPRPLPPPVEARARITIPYLTEPWYC